MRNWLPYRRRKLIVSCTYAVSRTVCFVVRLRLVGKYINGWNVELLLEISADILGRHDV